jgi:hypothetical protein
MNISYVVYQAERQRSVTEQREADRQAGELAAALASAGRAVKAAITGRTRTNRADAPPIPGDDLIPERSIPDHGARR